MTLSEERNIGVPVGMRSDAQSVARAEDQMSIEWSHSPLDAPVSELKKPTEVSLAGQ